MRSSGKQSATASGPATTTDGAGEDSVFPALAALLPLADNATNLPLLLKQIKTRVGVVPLVGAGMSVPFGYPTWRTFLEDMALDVALRQRVAALLDQGQYEEAAEALLAVRGENAFQAALEYTFGEHRLPKPLPPAAILQLPRLCFGPVLTTNFDPVLEKVFQNAQYPFEERILGMKVDALREAFHGNRRVLVKLHGDAADRTDRVLTWSDYERAYSKREPLTAILRFAMTRPLLFLGCSLGNDRTVRVLETLASELRRRRAEGLQVHYAIVERPAQDADFRARHRRLSNLGIRLIWYTAGQHGLIGDLLSYLTTNVGKSELHEARLHNVPDLPPNFLARDGDLGGLKAKLLGGSQQSVGITSVTSAPKLQHSAPAPQRAGLHGMGGIGKTVLAAALARDPTVLAAFPDGVFWLTISQTPDLLSRQHQLAQALTGQPQVLRDLQHGSGVLGDLLRDRAVLLVLDDVWSADHAIPFNALGPRCRLLITTRDQEVLKKLQADDHCVDLLSHEQALELLARWAGTTPNDLPLLTATDVVRECGHLPLAIAMMGAQANCPGEQRRNRLQLMLARLREKQLELFEKVFPEYQHPHLLRAIEVSVEALSAETIPRLRERYLDFAVFPEDATIPADVLRILWQPLGLRPTESDEVLDRLRQLSLLRQGEAGLLNLHDVQRSYVLKQVGGGRVAIHERLANAYRATAPHGWHTLKPDGYAFEHLLWHLHELGRDNDIRALLFDLRWLQARLDATDISDLLGDFAFLGKEEAARLLHSAIRLSAHVLAHQKTELPSQLAGRLPQKGNSQLRDFLTQLQNWDKWPWLRPLTPSLFTTGNPLLCTLAGHRDAVLAVAISDDGRTAVSGSADKSLKVWNLESGKLLFSLKGHQSKVTSAAMSSDGHLAVSASSNGTLIVWDLKRGTLLRQLPGPRGQMVALAISADARWAVTSSNEWRARVWDLDHGRLVQPLLHERMDEVHSISAAVVSADGALAITGSVHGMLEIWDLQAGRVLKSWRVHHGKIAALAVSQDLQRAVVSSGDKTLQVWDIVYGRLLNTLESDGGAVSALALSKNGHLAITNGIDHTVKVWDLENRKLLRSLEGHTSDITSMAMSSDSRLAITGSADATLRVWDLLQDAGRVGVYVAALHAVDLSADGRRAVTSSGDNILTVWDLLSGQLLKKLKGHTGKVTTVALAENGNHAVSGSTDKTVIVWDVEDGNILYVLEGHVEPVTSVAIRPDGRRAVSGAIDGTIVVWDLDSGMLVHALRAFGPDSARGTHKREEADSGINTVSLSQDGRVVLSGASDGTVRVWNVNEGKLLFTFTGHSSRIVGVVVSTDGLWGMSGSEDMQVKLWDLKRGRLQYELVHAHSVKSIAVSANGKWAASGSVRGHLDVWDLKKRRLIRSFKGHEDVVNTVCVSSDGQRLVSGSHDRTVKLWSLERCEPLAIFHAESKIRCCFTTPSAQTIMVGEESGRIHFLRLEGMGNMGMP